MTSLQRHSPASVGWAAAWVQVGLQTLYAVVTVVGLATLPSPDVQIQDPWFTLMEILILLMIAPLVLVFAALHQAAFVERKVYSLAALAFAVCLVTVTGLVHFSVLTLSRQPAFADAERMLGFAWPSVVYAADILAWDVFFPLMALAAAAALSGTGPQRLARWLLVASAGLAIVGILGVPLADMRVRNIGIVGYALVFPAALVALALAFRRNR